ncbi:hypothetical protein D3C79_838880 [compost metagenome]
MRLSMFQHLYATQNELVLKYEQAVALAGTNLDERELEFARHRRGASASAAYLLSELALEINGLDFDEVNQVRQFVSERIKKIDVKVGYNPSTFFVIY